MIFEELSVADAEGAILAHSVRVAGRLMKKGRVLSRADIAALGEAGVARVTAARLEPGDVPEDAAAARVARVLTGENVRMGAAFTRPCEPVRRSGRVGGVRTRCHRHRQPRGTKR